MTEDSPKITTSTYARATLLIQAFRALDSWGYRNEKNEWCPNDIARRKEIAADIVDWALKS